jgi:hypothetical protein
MSIPQSGLLFMFAANAGVGGGKWDVTVVPSRHIHRQVVRQSLPRSGHLAAAQSACAFSDDQVSSARAANSRYLAAHSSTLRGSGAAQAALADLE